ncbi:MAG: acetoacetate decarboxylase [Gammaproteobacteria bacterium]|nr:acetoacetate decarboxylase [Gammaproteobacteria bacterium]
MNKSDVVKKAFSMPLTAPAYPKGPYHFVNREFLTISYETDMDALKAVVPEPLEIVDNIVKYEFIHMPDSNGFGSYTESGQVITVNYKGETGGYVHEMYLDDLSPIVAGRELWGFPKKLATVSLNIETDTLVGKLKYGDIYVAIGSMGYKYYPLDHEECKKAISAPGFLLKIIPHVDGSARICELVRYRAEDVVIKSAWSGPAALQFFAHALAPVSALPVKHVVSASHILTDLTLPYGEVVYDYLSNQEDNK